jgi:hypothetical protein
VSRLRAFSAWLMGSAGGSARNNLPAEFVLLCSAVRQQQSLAEGIHLSRGEAPDWATVTEGARRHKLIPLLLSFLTSYTTDVPPALIAELQQEVIAAARRGLTQVAEIRRLSHAFKEAAIPVLVLKGEVLSVQLRRSIGLRDSRDIDLLVDSGQFTQAEAVITAAGYRRAGGDFTRRQSAAYRRWRKDVEYVHEVTGALLELHHRLTDNPYLLVCDFSTLWREREEVRLGDIAVATVSRGPLLLYLCVHGAGHAWERLRWLTDLATLLQEPGNVDAALETADAAGLEVAMLHAVMRSHDWLGLPVAERHLARARASKQVARLDRILAHLYAGEAWHEMPSRHSWKEKLRYSVWQRFYRFSLKSDWRYRANQFMCEWFSPADWDTLRLPHTMFWLYPAVRPLGWLMRRRQG